MLTEREKTDIQSLIDTLRERPTYGERHGLWQQRTLAALQTALGPLDSNAAMALRDRAQDIHHCEGSLEIDDHAIVSLSDEGAYVQAWVWVGSECVR